MDPISKVKISDSSYEIKDGTARLAIVTLNNELNGKADKATTLSGYGITDAINTSSAAQTKTGNLTAAKFITNGGTSSQFVKGDGSLDSNTYLTSYTETDPTVPAWAKQSTKPSYTPQEIGAQEEITTVNVSVDANTGTPSGSASFSGGTLNLSFSNLKGAKGDTGETGATGPQGQTGPQGPKGDTGVSGDASTLAIIHSIDQTTTYNDTDVAGADAVQTTDKNLIDDEYALYGILENLHKTKADKDKIPNTEEMELITATAIVDIKERIVRKASCHQITISSRPTNPTVGEHYYDITIHKPIWWSGTNWTDALGNNV